LIQEKKYVRFEVCMEVTMKNAIFWDVMPCGSSEQQPHGVTSQKMAFFSSKISPFKNK
jgi:hypothetical protein